MMYLIWYVFWSGDVDDSAENFCTLLNDTFIDWSDCNETIDNLIWFFVGAYLFFYVIFRLYAVRILYYYAKEISGATNHENQTYEKLDGDHHHNEHHAINE